MDVKKIKELMAAMEEKGMTRVHLKEENGAAIEIERKVEVQPVYETRAPQAAAAPAPQAAASPSKSEAPAPSAPDAEGYVITSPMVGTYYDAPSPDDDPFVKVGDTVTEDTVVCIIEAMKVMNEVKAGKKGKVVEIYNDKGHPVEFGTKLIRIET